VGGLSYPAHNSFVNEWPGFGVSHKKTEFLAIGMDIAGGCIASCVGLLRFSAGGPALAKVGLQSPWHDQALAFTLPT
jgi:hypothetical protein